MSQVVLSGSNGKAYFVELVGKSAGNIKILWYLHLPTVHPVVEWYAMALERSGSSTSIFVVGMDPEHYINKEFDPTKLESLVVDQSSCHSISIDGQPHLKDVVIYSSLLVAAIQGKLDPDPFYAVDWKQAAWAMRNAAF